MQRGVLTHADLGKKLGLAEGGEAEAAAAGAAPHFQPGDAVVVRQEDLATAWAKPHLRTPGYIFGKAGTVERICGSFDNPELLTIGLAGPSQVILPPATGMSKLEKTGGKWARHGLRSVKEGA